MEPGGSLSTMFFLREIHHPNCGCSIAMLVFAGGFAVPQGDFIHNSQKSPTGPTERTPKPEKPNSLIATY